MSVCRPKPLNIPGSQRVTHHQTVKSYVCVRCSVNTTGLWVQVSVTFPFFSTVVAIIAALGDLAGAYALPALFVLVNPNPWIGGVSFPVMLLVRRSSGLSSMNEREYKGPWVACFKACMASEACHPHVLQLPKGAQTPLPTLSPSTTCGHRSAARAEQAHPVSQ